MTWDSTGPGMESLTPWPIELWWKGYKKRYGWFWGWITYTLRRKWVQRTMTRDMSWSGMKLLTLCQANKMGMGGKTVRSDTSSEPCMQSLTIWKPKRKNQEEWYSWVTHNLLYKSTKPRWKKLSQVKQQGPMWNHLHTIKPIKTEWMVNNEKRSISEP